MTRMKNHSRSRVRNQHRISPSPKRQLPRTRLQTNHRRLLAAIPPTSPRARRPTGPLWARSSTPMYALKISFKCNFNAYSLHRPRSATRATATLVSPAASLGKCRCLGRPLLILCSCLRTRRQRPFLHPNQWRQTWSLSTLVTLSKYRKGRSLFFLRFFLFIIRLATGLGAVCVIPCGTANVGTGVCFCSTSVRTAGVHE